MQKFAAALAFLIVWMPANLSAAQSTTESVQLAIEGGFSSSSSLQGGDRGRASSIRSKVELSYHDFGIMVGRRLFTWADKEKIPFGNGSDAPWKRLDTIMLGASHNGMFGPRWGYWAGGAIYSNFEPDSRKDLTGGGYAGLLHILSEKWQISLGGAGELTPIGFDGFPVLLLHYNGALENGLSFSLGTPESEITYELSSMMSLRSRLLYDLATYRLSRESKVRRNGFIRLQESLAGIYVDLRPLPGLTISMGPEFGFLRRISIYNSKGERIKNYSAAPSPGASLRVSYTF